LEAPAYAAEASLMKRPPGGATSSLKSIWGGLRASQWFGHSENAGIFSGYETCQSATQDAVMNSARVAKALPWIVFV
jgi:hypothetical protein